MKHQKVIKIVTIIVVMFTFLEAGILTRIGGTKGQADTELKKLEKKFKDIGFSTAAKNEHLELHYYNEFKDKNLDLLNFYRIYNKKEIRDFLLMNPDYGAYTPFSFLAFKKLADAEDGDTTWYGYLDADTMLNIIGEKDQANRDRFKKMTSKIDEIVMQEMRPDVIKELTFDKPLPKNTLLKMVKKFDNDDTEEFVEEFIMEHDSLFTKRHFVIAGFLDLKFEFDDMDWEFDKYDAYWVSSLCHFEFSNAVFNHGGPQAGVFAPCSIYFYIPKGTKELHVGYATIENWLITTGITDEEQLKYMEEVARQVESVFKELGFVVKRESDQEENVKSREENTAIVQQTIQSDRLSSELSQLKSVINALRDDMKELKTEIKKLIKERVMPKSLPQSSKEFKTKKLELDAGIPKELSAYLVAQPQPLSSLLEKLKSNGFEILAITEILEGKVVVTITNEQLKDTNTFIAALNILVDEQDEIRLQNPSYFAAAYLQDKYKYGQFKEVLKSLQSVLGDMYLTEEKLDIAKLKDYNFMPNMSKFEDVIEIDDGRDLLEKIEALESEKYIAYRLKLPNGSTLVGHKMRLKENKFLNKVNEAKNAQLLPYQSMIHDNLAYMLDPTFYLALSLPLLSMEDFMKIASTPDDIGKSVRRAYR